MLHRPRIVTDITSYSLLYAHNTAVLCVTVCVTFGLIVAASHFITVNTTARVSPVRVPLRSVQKFTLRNVFADSPVGSERRSLKDSEAVQVHQCALLRPNATWQVW